MRTLRLPETLAFVALTGLAACNDDPKQPVADAAIDGSVCQLHCIRAAFYDDGGVIGDAGVICPICADPATECPSGCDPIG